MWCDGERVEKTLENFSKLNKADVMEEESALATA
jgi:hypothetical protein